MVMVLVEQQGQRGHQGEGAGGRAMDWVRIGVEERYPGLSSDSCLNVWKNDDLEKQQKAWLIWRIKGGKEETRG